MRSFERKRFRAVSLNSGFVGVRVEIGRLGKKEVSFELNGFLRCFDVAPSQPTNV
jgi:hypothetical protein